MKKSLVKRLWCGLAATSMAVSLLACGADGATQEEATEETAAPAVEEETVAETEETPTQEEATAETEETLAEKAAGTDAGEDLKEKYASLAGTTLRVGTGCAQAGWTMDDGTGNPEGMDIDVMNYICDYYGINIEWTVSEYASLWGMVQNGVIDTSANLTTVNDDRLGLYWFTNTYAWESYSIVSRTEDGIPEDGDMTFWNGKTIAGEAGSNATLV